MEEITQNESYKRAKEWVKNPYFDEEAKAEIQALLDKNDEKEITERFYKDIEFGTGEGGRHRFNIGTDGQNALLRKMAKEHSLELV